ncbi:HAD-IB family phosphatase [Oleisolibacter albus]|uniref:HAD-IB family phosphatase n=1 Tax=Oleisolibacter albus TaxID=2171757 RepID=UPI001EFC5A26|nr:HAD-IB family phosphatase [Oleisolibacter albus]
MRISPRLYIDFDGTISVADTTDLLLEQFAEPGWETVEQAWARGEIGSRECMARQVGLLRLTPEALEQFAAGLAIDPGFPGFMRLCREEGLAVTILSDGLDQVARMVLRRLGLDLPVLSNRLTSRGEDRWHLDFPHARQGCRAASGNCKCASVGGGIGHPATVLIGDGRSDFCGAGVADHVFAKGKLAVHCAAHGIAHTAFTGFSDLTPAFHTWLAEMFPAAADGRQVA